MQAPNLELNYVLAFVAGISISGDWLGRVGTNISTKMRRICVYPAYETFVSVWVCLLDLAKKHNIL